MSTTRSSRRLPRLRLPPAPRPPLARRILVACLIVLGAGWLAIAVIDGIEHLSPVGMLIEF